MEKLTFKQGEEKREELELPTLHFVVMDQWIDIIGEKALFAWLKFYTWCDRDRKKGDKPVDINLWEQSKIPDSFTKLIKKLGVGKDTFYNKIIKPLWNVGLIDIEEWEDSKTTGTKPMNIIVYKYPQNNKKLSFAKLEVIRNYDTDYSSSARKFGQLGGRPKKESTQKESTQHNNENLNKEIDSQLEQMFGGFSNRTGGVLSQNRGGSQIEQGVFSLGTGGGSQIEHNNILNSFSNSFNSLNNILNNYNNRFNSSSNIFNKSLIEEEENKSIEINKFTISTLKKFYNDFVIEQITKEMKNRKISTFSEKQIIEQVKRIELYVSNNKKPIGDMGKFFVNGILQYEPSEIILDRDDELKKMETAKKEISKTAIPKVPFYNWLEQ